jgi:hypothetical protein
MITTNADCAISRALKLVKWDDIGAKICLRPLASPTDSQVNVCAAARTNQLPTQRRRRASAASTQRRLFANVLVLPQYGLLLKSALPSEKLRGYDALLLTVDVRSVMKVSCSCCRAAFTALFVLCHK